LFSERVEDSAVYQAREGTLEVRPQSVVNNVNGGEIRNWKEQERTLKRINWTGRVKHFRTKQCHNYCERNIY
jgi:hypothetical protein